VFAVIMKVLGYVGIAVVVIGLLIIPQLQYRKNPDGYFMIVEDYEQYAEKYQEQQ
jgi:PTS system ascorbate-specific IIC component